MSAERISDYSAEWVSGDNPLMFFIYFDKSSSRISLFDGCMVGLGGGLCFVKYVLLPSAHRAAWTRGQCGGTMSGGGSIKVTQPFVISRSERDPGLFVMSAELQCPGI